MPQQQQAIRCFRLAAFLGLDEVSSEPSDYEPESGDERLLWDGRVPTSRLTREEDEEGGLDDRFN